MSGDRTGFWVGVAIAAFVLFVFASVGDGSGSYGFREEPMFCYGGPSGEGEC